MRRLAVLAFMLAFACGALPTASQPTPTANVLAVLVDLYASTSTSTYDIALVAADGRVVAATHAQKRSSVPQGLELPYVSASNSRVYYLDGDSNIRYLKPDGSFGLATTVPGSATVHAAFAVTPDDARIAVTLLDYSVNPVQLSLYVEDLGGAHHKEIFTSTNRYVWPVAWHSGRLVVANLGPSGVPFTSTYNYSSRSRASYPYGPNPYSGINFHVIDPVTAQREVIISGGGASGLLTKSGTAEVQGAGTSWSGQPISWNSINDYGSYNATGSLSPDGHMIAACCQQPGDSGQLVIWYQDGSTKVLEATASSIDWAGWYDSSHLVTGFYQRADGTPTVVDIKSNHVTAVDAHGIVAAMFPGSLDG